MITEKEKKYFAELGEDGGILNADDDFFAVGKNQWVNAQNIRSASTDKGYTATIESIGGTLRISTPSPSVSFIQIGKIEDIVGNRIIYFYANQTTTQHKIEVYDRTADTIYLALLSSQVTGGLNFSKDHLIHGRVVNGVAYWTDNYNQPRKLNIDAAIKMNNPSYSTTQTAYTNPLEASVISLIRMPPAYPLNPSKTTLGGVTVNFVEEFAGYFAWRFTFRDNEISVLSPVSKLVNYNTVTDTYNAVELVATDASGNAPHIPQDVQTVDFCVRYAGSTRFFIIKTWDKRIASEATEIANHNAGIDPLSYVFYNNRIGIALSDDYSVKPFDSVPILSETLETGLNRLFLGNNTVSYNTPTLSSLAISLVPETNHTPYQNPSFHSASTYQIGIIFRDQYKRVIGNVFTNDTLRFTVPDRDYLDSTYYYYIAWTLSNANAVNEIPEDAYYYEIVMTKNLRTRFFVQAKAGKMQYAIKDPNTNVITYQDAYSNGAYGLAIDLGLLNAAGMGYQFQENDIIKLWLSASATIYSLKVITQDGNYVIATLENLGNFATQPNIIFELYSPYAELGSEPYYTTGLTVAINNPGDITRTYGSLGGNIYGDVYRFGRFSPTGSYNAENMSPAVKFWKEWNTNSGEPNFVINSVQVQKYTAVQWSNVIIEGSQTNGLSTFDALDEKILPLALGALRKLQQTSKVQEQGNVMLAIGEQETASCYLGEVQLVGASSNAFLAQAPNVIGTVNVLKGSFGTINPESVVEYRGNVYWLDANNGRVIQYSANGLFPISNYKMVRFWKNWCYQYNSMTAAEIEALGGRPFVFSAVDPAHDELLFSIPKLASDPPKGYLPVFSSTIDAESNIIYPFDVLDMQGKTMVYDLKNDRWIGSYSFNPEGFAVIQNELYSFKTGQMYRHNQYDNPCEFYGVQYKAKIMFVSNMYPSVPKTYNAVAVEANMQPSYLYLYNDYPYQQISDLCDYQFRPLEGVWNGTFQRNIIQPTATGNVLTGRLTGERMRSVAMLFMAEFTVSSGNNLALKFFNITFTPSLGNVNV